MLALPRQAALDHHQLALELLEGGLDRGQVFERDGMLYSPAPFIEHLPGESPFEATVRFRTIGDMTCTGAVRSSAANLEEIIAEVAAARITERGATRADDRFSEAAMEDRKKEGYF